MRGGLPASEVSAPLAACDSNRISMYFCAWRDRLVVERERQRGVDRQASAHPAIFTATYRPFRSHSLRARLYALALRYGMSAGGIAALPEYRSS
ncbi:hypothetical protein [Burkholderia pseudomallei]|uniref:hypothetical protein n=1 Tax=Burkholderia pseudomallei TaxID=28450 RepID=UPI0005722D45|nr:hypothetical protein [Burkholderia pseudomallei]